MQGLLYRALGNKKAEENLAALVRPSPGQDATQIKVEGGEMEGVGACIRLMGVQLHGSGSANI